MDIMTKFHKQLMAAIEDEVVTLCSCAAAGVPISSMAVIHAAPSMKIGEPIEHHVFLSINYSGLGLIRGRRYTSYQM